MRVPKWVKGHNGSGQITWKSASGTDVGRLREMNEDDFLDMTDRQLWCVADGMGGHAAGDVASGAVVAAHARIATAATLNTASSLVAGAITQANDELRHMAHERGEGVVIGTTVVSAVARKDRMAILWAGDSRAYRLRKNTLTQLTVDHDLVSEMQMRNAPEALIESVRESNVVARAVGAHDRIDIDEVRVGVLPGDVYLLCSDGLHREVPEDRISLILRETDPARAVALLLDAALIAGGRDNITAVVIHAR